MLRHLSLLLSLLVAALTACAPAAGTPAPTAEPGNTPSSARSAVPAWLSLPLIDVRTGETFTFADFSGKTVLARAVAEW